MSLISNESMTIKDKTFRLTLRIVENILKVLKRKGIQNYNSYLSDRMNTPRPNISRMLNCDGNITIKTLLKLLDAAELEMEIKFFDRNNLTPIVHSSIATVRLPEIPKVEHGINEDVLIQNMNLIKSVSVDGYSILKPESYFIMTPKNFVSIPLTDNKKRVSYVDRIMGGIS